ncbi:MAG: arginyltransferase [Myxococcales bacterium]|nr:arginyltransferase [Myxococcales bacterium]
MARQLRQWVAEPVACAYLPDEQATLEYRLLLDVSGDELDVLLELGWRRFGPAYFRPACSACSECVPLRIPVDRFRMSKQQRRVWNKVQDRLEVVEQSPQIDEQRLQLYRRWHVAQGQKRDWPSDNMDRTDYYHQFAFPHPCGRELSYWDHSPASGPSPRLVGIAITDVTPSALSAVYTYYDPEYAKLSLGTASVLFQLQRARDTGRDWLYLGYRVSGCPSSEYKHRFQPHQLLTYSAASAQTQWEDVAGRWSKA